tara:strand:+ start:68 stop:1636 length:1569 start_codon:yes stop_codon:yes gene_type:complete
MARNGSGTYSNPYPDFISGTVISSSEVDANNSDIATALTQSIAVDGQAVVTADIPLATHKFTVMKVGAASTDSLSLGQAQAEAFVWCGTAGGSANAITLSPSPAITAYAAGQRFVWMASGSVNTGATTVAISGLSAIALQDNGAALVAGNHEAGKMFIGILNTTSTVQIMQVQVSGNDPLVVNSLTVTTDATIGDDLTLLSDSAVLGFGENTDVTLTHVHNTGLNLKNNGTSASPAVLLLQTGDTDIAASDVLGKIEFNAPDEESGTDALLVAGAIDCVSEGDFSSSSNASKLSFRTGVSGAATEKMSLSSAGLLSLNGSSTDVGGGTYGVYVNDGALRSDGATNDNTKFQLLHYNSDATLCFYVRNDGLISTGVDGNSPYNYTTASATNMYVASNGALYRSTSSLRWKANVEAIENEWADKVLDLEPMFFRSTAPGDSEMPDHWTHYGFAAEQVATIDPRLVEYKTHEFHMEGVEEISTELDEPTVEGVQYERIIPALINLLRRQRDEIAALTTRVKALEA